MSYDPTQWASQPPEPQPPAQQPPPAPAPPPGYGQSNPNWQPAPPASPPGYGQSNPNWQPAPPAPTPPPGYGGQSNPNWGQTQQASTPPPGYGQSNPSWQPAPPAPTPPPGYGQSNPNWAPTQQAATPPSFEPIPQTPAPGAFNQFAPQPPVDPYAPPQQPMDPYAPAPGQPYQPGMPPGYQPPAPPQKKSNLKVILIVLIVILVVVAGGGGTALYFASRPQPTISVTSKYTASSLPAGSSSTTLTVTGKDFSGNSAITFLLDNAPAPGASTAQSDSNGNVTATLTVTDAWSVGNHTLTAKDASGYTTKVSKQITIVTPGQAGTPGPNGAPTDSASGTIDVTVEVGGQGEQTTLTVTGSATGGKICGTGADGQPHSHSGVANGLTYTETIVKTCSGTYKGGKIDYTETTTTDKIIFDNGGVCSTPAPFVNAHLVGTFSSATAVSGSFSEDQTSLTCVANGQSNSTNVAAQSGTWTGNASMQ